MQRHSDSFYSFRTSLGAQKYPHFAPKSPGPYFSPIDPHLRHYYERKQLRSAPCSSPAGGKDSSKAHDSPSLTRPSSCTNQTSYVVAVKTYDHPKAGTNAKVYITLHGDKGKISKKRLVHGSRRKGDRQGTFKFEPGSVEKFRIRGPPVGDLVQVHIENSGRREDQGWWLDHIAVKEATSGKKWLFPCNKWLSLHHGDCATQRTLLPKQSEETSHPYTVQLFTGNVRGAGTDANVFVTLAGEKATSAKTHVTGCKFTSGATETFVMVTKDVGEMKSLTVEHDNTGFGPSWFLDKVTVTDHLSNETVVFPCGVWLARDEGDGDIRRVLYPSHTSLPPPQSHTYLVTTTTGNMKGAGTDSSVYISLHGSKANSGEWRLENSKSNFERGRIDTFCLKMADLGDLQRVTVRHDWSSSSRSWYLVQVEVRDERGVAYLFPCHQWLSADEGDGSTERELTLSRGEPKPLDSAGSTSQQYKYTLLVITGNQVGSTSNADVYVTLHGGGGATERVWVDKCHLKRGHTHRVEVLSPVLVDPVDKICVGHDSPGHETSWYLEKIELEAGGQKVVFLSQGWLGSEVGRVEVELHCTIPIQSKLWRLCVWTSDLLGAGTDANVFLQVFGEDGRGSRKLLLGSSVENFERGQVDMFEVELEGLGTPQKVVIGHDNTGPYPDWHLEKVELISMATGARYLCPCGRWLATGGGGTTAELKAILVQGSVPSPPCDPGAMGSVPCDPGAMGSVHCDPGGIGSVASPCDPDEYEEDYEDGGDDDILEKSIEEEVSSEVARSPGTEEGHHEVARSPEGHHEVARSPEGHHEVARSPEGHHEVARSPEGHHEVARSPEGHHEVARSPEGHHEVAGSPCTEEGHHEVARSPEGHHEVARSPEGHHEVARSPEGHHEVARSPEGHHEVARSPEGHHEVAGSPRTEGHHEVAGSPRTEEGHHEVARSPCTESSHTHSTHSKVSQKITYTVHTTVTSRSVPDSGAHLAVILCGEQLTSNPIPLKVLCSRSGALATTETFSVMGQDVGVVRGVKVWLDTPNPGECWMVTEMCLAHPHTDEVLHFPCGRWVGAGPPHELRPADLLSSTTGAASSLTTSGPGDKGTATSSLIGYEVKVTTADKKHSGYPQKVLLVLVGENGHSNTFEFKNSTRSPKFQRGQTDIFQIACKDIGPLKSVRVAHCSRRKEQKLIPPGHPCVKWYLFEVCLIRMVDKQKYHFFCRQWIAESGGSKPNFTELTTQKF